MRKILSKYMTNICNDLTKQCGANVADLSNLEIVGEGNEATHSSTLAWRIPGMAEPGELPSMGSHRVGHD